MYRKRYSPPYLYLKEPYQLRDGSFLWYNKINRGEHIKGGEPMDILCTTSLDNNEQVKNLCECIEILGGRPCVSGCTVCVEYHGEKDTLWIILNV